MIYFLKYTLYKLSKFIINQMNIYILQWIAKLTTRTCKTFLHFQRTVYKGIYASLPRIHQSRLISALKGLPLDGRKWWLVYFLKLVYFFHTSNTNTTFKMLYLMSKTQFQMPNTMYAIPRNTSTQTEHTILTYAVLLRGNLS